VPKELKVEPVAALDDDLPEALRLLPERLVALGNRDGLTREQIAVLAGRDAANVGRWLGYKGLQKLAASAIIGLERGFRLAPGTLLSPYPIDLGQAATPVDVAHVSETMGISPSVMRALADGSGEKMSEYGIGLRRAILGAVHLMGLPLETVLIAASAAKAKIGAVDLQPEAWLSEMRPFLKEKKLESGSYPSYSSIKIG
jgi:hypothetical protein